jgi:hypothetical protein
MQVEAVEVLRAEAFEEHCWLTGRYQPGCGVRTGEGE